MRGAGTLLGGTGSLMSAIGSIEKHSDRSRKIKIPRLAQR
jgi:hypothetical protein